MSTKIFPIAGPRSRQGTHPCPQCGTATLNEQECCSRICSNILRAARTEWIELTCELCGEPFAKKASELPPHNKTTNAVGKYCSNECRFEAQRRNGSTVAVVKGKKVKRVWVR